MNNVRWKVGWLATTVLILVSLLSIYSSGEVGSNSWISLLLIPFTISLALSGGESNPIVVEEGFEWMEDEEDIEKNEISPGDFGYDTPIL
ncbi:MAG: hypothetical protein VYA94_04465 [Candidatus Thermoplasmatota archaeon]|nr:hypothetical protein [Candidatus Thermoplasmatota archaeon]